MKASALNEESKQSREEYCKKELRKMVRRGQKVYCQLRHVSSSGMSRRISLHVIYKGEICCIDHLAADVLGMRVSDKGGIMVSGSDMDMGFYLVRRLSRALHGDKGDMADYAFVHAWL